MIGINTFKKLTHKFEGLGFAISISVALKAFDALWWFSSSTPGLAIPSLAVQLPGKPVDKKRKTVVCKLCISFHILGLDVAPQQCATRWVAGPCPWLLWVAKRRSDHSGLVDRPALSGLHVPVGVWQI